MAGSSQPIGYLAAALTCAATSVVALHGPQHLAPANLMLLYVLSVVVTAAGWGRGPGVLASVAAVICYDFFLVPPRFSLSVEHAQSLVTLAVMLVVSLVIGHLTTRLREKTLEVEARAAESALLNQLACQLAGAGSLEEVRSRARSVLAPFTGTRSPSLDSAVQAVIATAEDRIRLVEKEHVQSLEIQRERLRSSLLSALSHDLRTPLTVLFGNLDALATRADLPADTSSTLALMRSEAHRLDRMMENLLDMARLQTGAIHLRRDWQSIPELLGACLRVVTPWLAGHPVELRLPSDLPLVAADAVLLERVFHNLLENAAKYSPPDTPIIVSVEAPLATPAWLQVAFANAGQGFPPDRLEAVFDLFERGNGESAQPGSGVGLGLCRSIVEAHGGKISARNVPGGCVVAFTLPLAPVPPLPAEAETGLHHV